VVLATLDETVPRVGRILLHARRSEGAASVWCKTDGIVFCGKESGRLLRERRAYDAGGGFLAVDGESYLKRDSGQLDLFGPTLQAAHDQAFLRTSMYLAPSWRVGPEIGSLRAVLEAGERFLEAVDQQSHSAPGYVPVVVRPGWRGALLDDMCAELWSSGIPVAFLFAGGADPLSSRREVAAAVKLVSAVPSSIVLRCDLSAIGLVSFGAQLASIGATSGMRHVFVPMPKANNKPRDKSAHVLVPALRAWVRGSKLNHIDGPVDLFRCVCRVCDGRSVLRFRESEPHAGLIRDEAEAHGALAWREIADRVLADDEVDPRRAWLDECEAGLESYRILRKEGLGLSPPGYLSAWSSLT
jgi:hypothetical protein